MILMTCGLLNAFITSQHEELNEQQCVVTISHILDGSVHHILHGSLSLFSFLLGRFKPVQAIIHPNHQVLSWQIMAQL